MQLSVANSYGFKNLKHGVTRKTNYIFFVELSNQPYFRILIGREIALVSLIN